MFYGLEQLAYLALDKWRDLPKCRRFSSCQLANNQYLFSNTYIIYIFNIYYVYIDVFTTRRSSEPAMSDIFLQYVYSPDLSMVLFLPFSSCHTMHTPISPGKRLKSHWKILYIYKFKYLCRTHVTIYYGRSVFLAIVFADEFFALKKFPPADFGRWKTSCSSMWLHWPWEWKPMAAFFQKFCHGAVRCHGRCARREGWLMDGWYTYLVLNRYMI